MTQKEFIEQINKAKEKNSKLDAVKFISNTTGIGLKNSKDTCDDYWNVKSIDVGKMILGKIKRTFPDAKAIIKSKKLIEHQI